MMHTLRSKEPNIASEFRDYVYGVSHDVGAPVRTMVEFSRLLIKDHAQKLNEEGKLYLSLIIENGKKLQNMMDGLLDYSRLNTEAQPFTAVDCALTLKNAMTVLDDVIHMNDARIDAYNLPEIIGDSTQIWQLFVALLDNALKFHVSGSKPHINIEAHRQSDIWKFSFADNGIGIDPRFCEKIFGVFQRLHSDEEYPGVGIGLTLAQRIVRRHGGEIWVESGTKNGSIFYFTIPVDARQIS